MKIQKLSDMKCGWFIGDFEPCVLRTKDFEVAVHRHKAGEFHASHVHNFSTEYNCLIQGKMSLNGISLNAGDIFTIDMGEEARDIIFQEDCVLVVVKTPSIPSDKQLINN